MRSAREASSSSDGTQRVSLKDIADELGISQTAVSFAINDRPGVSAETKRRVKEAAARLGWTPVYAAQALGSSKTMTIGFAPARSTQGLTDESFMLHFMAGVHASLSPKGYGLLYRPCRFLNEEMSVYKDWASRKRVDGVILVDLRADDPRPELLKNLGVRAVLAGGPDPNNYVPSLSIDDSRTMGTVLEHLSSLGYRRIAYLSGDPNLDYSQGRVAASAHLPNGESWNPSTSNSPILLRNRPRCSRWRCCIHRSRLPRSSMKRRSSPRPVFTPWPKIIPLGRWRRGRAMRKSIRMGCPPLSVLKTVSFVRRRIRQLPPRIVMPANTVPKWPNCCSKCLPESR